QRQGAGTESPDGKEASVDPLDDEPTGQAPAGSSSAAVSCLLCRPSGAPVRCLREGGTRSLPLDRSTLWRRERGAKRDSAGDRDSARHTDRAGRQSGRAGDTTQPGPARVRTSDWKSPSVGPLSTTQAGGTGAQEHRSTPSTMTGRTTPPA